MTDLIDLAGSFEPGAISWDRIEPYYQQLLDRTILSADDAQRWLGELARLHAQVDEVGSRLYIAYTCHTDDPTAEKAYLDWVRQVEPKLQPVYFQLKGKYLASPCDRAGAAGPLALMRRRWRCDVELYRDANVPLATRETEGAAEYGKLCGAMVVRFDQRQQTLQQMARYLDQPDRATRQAAWETIEQRCSEDGDRIDGLFDRLLALRAEIAANAELASYRDYAWKAKNRFNYGPAQCDAFADAVETTCVPLLARLDRKRADDLSLASLRPWDLAVDPHQQPPLRPFRQEDIGPFCDRTGQMLQQIDPDFGRQFALLQQSDSLDLESRPGKQPGGYQCSLEYASRPFIFMNAAGLHRDVQTLLHEAGHAFHYLAACAEPNVFLRHAPLEFCEVASMSMELLAMDHLDLFYNAHDAARARRIHLEQIVRLLPWVATIDQFQHWIYTHPGHDGQQRRDEWLALRQRFASPVLNYSGIESALTQQWHRQGHLFRSPFYYIEYGIAQLGALQVWQQARQDLAGAVTRLRAAFALGGKEPLPALFEASGIHFDFSSDTVAPLISAVEEELAKLPP